MFANAVPLPSTGQGTVVQLSTGLAEAGQVHLLTRPPQVVDLCQGAEGGLTEGNGVVPVPQQLPLIV